MNDSMLDGLAGRYRENAAETPPAALDHRILAASRAQSPRQVPTPWLALAASALIAALIVGLGRPHPHRATLARDPTAGLLEGATRGPLLRAVGVNTEPRTPLADSLMQLRSPAVAAGYRVETDTTSHPEHRP